MAIARKPKGKPSKIGASTTWQLQAAKAQFSEVIRRACTAGPQVITKQGRAEAVIVGMEDFQRLTQRAKPSQCLLQFFAQSPLAEFAVDLERRPDYGRGVDL
jgi:antitoxin Phd